MKKRGLSVLIVMGSDSDAVVMEEAAKALDAFAVPYEMTVTSAHRSPDRTRAVVARAVSAGVRVFIVGAGAAAHLPGVIAAETTLPVIGVPIDSSSLAGLDALLSIVQMPGGVPVATMAIGKAGAKNAGILAVQILALEDPTLRERLAGFKADQEKAVAQRAARLKKIRESAAGPGR